ncbi:MAG: N-acetylmuramoyl-L-alanine amidase family protein [Thermomicrobiales bacterium]
MASSGSGGGSFNSGGSRWSSERQRQERERQREAQKELMRKARLEREAKAKEDEEARLAAERAARTPTPTPPVTTTPPPITTSRPATMASPVAPETTGSAGTSGVGRKWRSSVETDATGGGLPDIPEISGGGRGGGNRSGGISGRIILFAGGLFVLMAIVAFLPFGPFGGGGSPTTPTPTDVVPVLGPSTPSATDQAVVAPTAPSDGSRVVCIDPGHGGWDTGFQRTWDEMTPKGPALNESELNLGMAYMLKAELEAQGITVVMTRTGGNAVNVYGEDVNGDGKTIFDGANDAERRQNADYDELQARINICNAAHADILVSLHINGYDTDPSVNGYEVLYTAAPARPFGDLSHQLADTVYRRIYTSLSSSGYGGTARGVKDDSELDANKYPGYGASQHLLLLGPEINTPLRKLKPSEMPGIIIEPVFLSNEDDANFIANPDNQKLLVDAYAQGILEYFAANPG